MNGRREGRPTVWDRSFDGYRRRVDAWEYRSKRRDMPRDADRLLELARDIELEERIILDRKDSVSY